MELPEPEVRCDVIFPIPSFHHPRGVHVHGAREPVLGKLVQSLAGHVGRPLARYRLVIGREGDLGGEVPPQRSQKAVAGQGVS